MSACASAYHSTKSNDTSQERTQRSLHSSLNASGQEPAAAGASPTSKTSTHNTNPGQSQTSKGPPKTTKTADSRSSSPAIAEKPSPYTRKTGLAPGSFNSSLFRINIDELNPTGMLAPQLAEAPTPTTQSRHHLQRFDSSEAGCTQDTGEPKATRHLCEMPPRLAPSWTCTPSADPRSCHRHASTRDTTDNDCVAWFQMIDTAQSLCNEYMYSRSFCERFSRSYSTVNPYRAPCDNRCHRSTAAGTSPQEHTNIRCAQ